MEPDRRVPWCNCQDINTWSVKRDACCKGLEGGGGPPLSQSLGGLVTDRPRALENPAVQALQKRAHKIAEDEKAQQAEERAEDADVVGRLVSATTSSEFRTATGVLPQQYAICRWQKSCD